MSTSNKRSLIFIIIFLLLTNLGVLAYFLWNKKPEKPADMAPKRDGIATALQKEVGFDSIQIAEYRKLKEQQWAAIRPMFEDIRKSKDSFYRMVSDEAAGDSVIGRAADVIGQKQRTIDMQAFKHFRQIRALCKPDQLERYDSLVQRMVRKWGRPPRPNDQTKKDRK